MMRAGVAWALVGTIAACGGGGGPDIHATTSFTITELAGSGPSPLDPLSGQPITIDLVMDDLLLAHAAAGGCRSTIFGKIDPQRTAGGPAAATMQTEVLDRLPEWDVELELCAVASQSSIEILAVIDELNLEIGCLTLPASAMVDDGTDPVLTSFTAAGCSATILDVVANRVVGARDFTVRFEIGPDRLP
jgi:hypothetical protein